MAKGKKSKLFTTLVSKQTKLDANGENYYSCTSKMNEEIFLSRNFAGEFQTRNTPACVFGSRFFVFFSTGNKYNCRCLCFKYAHIQVTDFT